MITLTPLDIAKFWMLVKENKSTKIIRDAVNWYGHCWEWQGSFLDSGYGRIGFNNKSHRAHRISYYLYHGNISNEKIICHKCDNPKCVNPLHLYEGTNAENMEDRDKRKRRKSPGKHKGSSSQYHGVFLRKNKNSSIWRVVIGHKYKSYRLGVFKEEIEAAKAYNEFVVKLNETLPDNEKKPLNTIYIKRLLTEEHIC